MDYLFYIKNNQIHNVLIFIIVALCLHFFLIEFFVKKYSNLYGKRKHTDQIFKKIKKQVDKKTLVFNDSKLSDSIVTTLIKLQHNDTTLHMVVLNNNFKTLYSVEFVCDIAHVQTYKIMFLKEEIKSLEGLVNYVCNETCFDITAYHDLSFTGNEIVFI